MSSPQQTNAFIASTTLDNNALDYLDVCADQYTATFKTQKTPKDFLSAIDAAPEEEYTIQQGHGWEDALHKETVTYDMIKSLDDILYIQDDQNVYKRSFFEADDRSTREITVTVPRQHGQYVVTPLYDALNPFYEDGDILEIVDSVEEVLKDLEHGEIEKIYLP